MSPIRYEDLDKELQDKIHSNKMRYGWTIVIAVLCSLILPIIVQLFIEYVITRPKETVNLVYDINQPTVHATGEYVTQIEIENIGEKTSGDTPVVFEIKFGGKILSKEWKLPLDSTSIIGEEGGPPKFSWYRIRFKNFGGRAKCSILFKSTEDLLTLPILKYSETFCSPRVLNTIRQDLK